MKKKPMRKNGPKQNKLRSVPLEQAPSVRLPENVVLRLQLTTSEVERMTAQLAVARQNQMSVQNAVNRQYCPPGWAIGTLNTETGEAQLVKLHTAPVVTPEPPQAA